MNRLPCAAHAFPLIRPGTLAGIAAPIKTPQSPTDRQLIADSDSHVAHIPPFDSRLQDAMFTATFRPLRRHLLALVTHF